MSKTRVFDGFGVPDKEVFGPLKPQNTDPPSLSEAGPGAVPQECAGAADLGQNRWEVVGKRRKDAPKPENKSGWKRSKQEKPTRGSQKSNQSGKLGGFKSKTGILTNQVSKSKLLLIVWLHDFMLQDRVALASPKRCSRFWPTATRFSQFTLSQSSKAGWTGGSWTCSQCPHQF